MFTSWRKKKKITIDFQPNKITLKTNRFKMKLYLVNN